MLTDWPESQNQKYKESYLQGFSSYAEHMNQVAREVFQNSTPNGRIKLIKAHLSSYKPRLNLGADYFYFYCHGAQDAIMETWHSMEEMGLLD